VTRNDEAPLKERLTGRIEVVLHIIPPYVLIRTQEYPCKNIPYGLSIEVLLEIHYLTLPILIGGSL